MIRSRVASVASYLPDRVVTNDDLTIHMDTSDEWIATRTGIKERRWVEAGVATSDLALEAANRALAAADVAAEDVDMIFLATLSPDHEFPGTACFLQAKLERPGIPAVDVRQQCTGFIYATSMADMYIRAGEAATVLVVGAEIHSKGLDVSTEGRDVAVLFGDGAGAMVLQATEVTAPERDRFVYSTHLAADGRYARELWIPAPGMADGEAFIDEAKVAAGMHFPQMNGRQVFVHAVTRMPEILLTALDRNGVKLDEVDLFVFHQANLRINEAVADKLGIPAEKVYNTIDRFGNTTAATIPIGLDEAQQAGRLEPGMLVASAAFGSGFTWGSMLLRW